MGDLETMEQELLNEHTIIVTPKLFGLNDDFEVTLQHRLGIKQRTLMQHGRNDDDDGLDEMQISYPVYHDKRGLIFKRMATEIGAQSEFKEEEDSELETKRAFEKLFREKGAKTYDEKLNLY